MSITVNELAALVGGEIEGCPDAVISGVASVEDAHDSDVVLAKDNRFFERALLSSACCILTDVAVGKAGSDKIVIRVARPDLAFAKVLETFKTDEWLPAAGIGLGAVVEEDAWLGENVSVGANCYVGHGAEIGEGTVLFPNVYVGEGVRIGKNTKIYPGAVIYGSCSIGNRVVLHAGVVIGADGFGYAAGSSGLVKLEHIGTVEIGDDVEIGANSAVDRAKTGATIIGNGTKIDNLVHIAHNVKIGAYCAIVALSGVAGSVEIGNGVTLAAQSGIKDQIKIGDGCTIAARAGVISDLSKGQIVSGFPARDHMEERRSMVAWQRLPDILKRLRSLEEEVEGLRDKVKRGADDNI